MQTAVWKCVPSVVDEISSKRNEIECPVEISVTLPDLKSSYRWYISSERIAELRHLVQEAIFNHQVFAVNGRYESVRRSLLKRGWLEKIPLKPTEKTKKYRFGSPPGVAELTIGLPELEKGESSDDHKLKCEKLIIGKMLQDQDVDLFWNFKGSDIAKGTIISRLGLGVSSKKGLCAALTQMYWHYDENVAYTNFPRCYHTSFADELQDFMDDYRLSACMSLLKCFLETLDSGGSGAVKSLIGTLQLDSLQFAIDRCNEYSTFVKHGDIDRKDKVLKDADWDRFLKNHFRFVHKKKIFFDRRDDDMDTIKVHAIETLDEMAKCWPQFKVDGKYNIWIVKPGNSSKGIGIQLLNNYHNIIPLLSQLPAKDGRHVIQKYIENPLLIHDTKFDIRQWFLVTKTMPLEIWMYKECYLRFCSKKYRLANLHQSIHLTNNAVQRKYQNDVRSPELPDNNMWDSQTFQMYLAQNGHATMWESVIYPMMKQSIVGSMLAGQENFSHRERCFALYGADFMLAPDFTPWLLEINSCPQMSATTHITARLCPQVLEDVIKVVVDRQADPNASLGQFELIYEQMCPPVPPTQELVLRGSKIVMPVSDTVSSRRAKRESVAALPKAAPSSGLIFNSAFFS